MKRWQRIPSLPLQLFIITVLPLTLLLLAIAFGSLGLHQRAMRMMVGERDERATWAAASAIREQIDHRRSAIRGVALQAATAVGPEHAVSDIAYLQPDFEGGIAVYGLDGELLAAVNGLEDWQARMPPEKVRTFETGGAQCRLAPAVELALYRIAQEGVSNVARHAQTKHATVRIDFTEASACLMIRDDGIGFEVPESPAEMAPAGHYGLLGVQERVEAMGARLHIESAPGQGTCLQIVVPTLDQ